MFEKPRAASGWSNFIATVVALIGIGAGYAFVNFKVDPAPTVANYADQRAWREAFRAALEVTSLTSGFAALVIAAIARARIYSIGAIAGVIGVMHALFWVPANMRFCCGGDESNVIGMLRAINNAQQAYSISCAQDKGFADSLATLTTPPLPGAAPFLGADLGKGVWRGYAVTFSVPDGAVTGNVACDDRRVVSKYFIEAHLIDAIPQRRNFATDERGTVYANSDGTAIRPGMAGAAPVQW